MFPPETEAKLEAAINDIAQTLTEDFDPLADIATLVRQAVTMAESFGDLDGPEKKALALAFLERVIDECFSETPPGLAKMIEDLDLPGPEFIEQTVWDPLLKAAAPKILVPVLKMALPHLVDLVVDAASGALDINRHHGRTP